MASGFCVYRRGKLTQRRTSNLQDAAPQNNLGTPPLVFPPCQPADSTAGRQGWRGEKKVRDKHQTTPMSKTRRTVQARRLGQLAGTLFLLALTATVPAMSTSAVPPVFAMHGDADTLVPIAPARDTVAALTRAGYDAEMRELPGVGHTIASSERSELETRVRAAVAREAAAAH